MECPYGRHHIPCDYEIEYAVQSEALDEAYDQYSELSDEIRFLTARIEQLERILIESGIPIPIEM